MAWPLSHQRDSVMQYLQAISLLCLLLLLQLWHCHRVSLSLTFFVATNYLPLLFVEQRIVSSAFVLQRFFFCLLSAVFLSFHLMPKSLLQIIASGHMRIIVGNAIAYRRLSHVNSHFSHLSLVGWLTEPFEPSDVTLS